MNNQTNPVVVEMVSSGSEQGNLETSIRNQNSKGGTSTQSRQNRGSVI